MMSYDELAVHLKKIAICIILIACAFGVAFPLLGRRLKCRKTGGTFFVFTESFAFGVILATGFVHLLPEVNEVVHLLPEANDALTDKCLPETAWLKFPFADFTAMLAILFNLLVDFGRTQYYERKRLQVLQMGDISYSAIIGLSLGVSQSPCIVKSLMATLSFHQFVEGFALGACVSQAGFKSLPAFLIACLFAIITPAFIAIGIGVSSIYNPNSPRALILEGTFDSISAGILIYMSIVDPTDTYFLSKEMCCNPKLQRLSYIALLMGVIMMVSFTIWA